MGRHYSPTGAVELDTDRFPLVVQRLHRPLKDADLGWTFDRFEQLLARGDRYALIVWPIQGIESALSPVQRRAMAEWEQRVAPMSRRSNVCTAIVLRSRVQRGFFTAYRWLSEPATPQMVFGHAEDAERWATDMLRAEGLEVPAAPPSTTSAPPPA